MLLLGIAWVGVALRDVVVNNPGHFGGIITVGSPLNGAEILNHLNNGAAKRFVDKAKEELAAGPHSTISLLNIIFDGFNLLQTFNLFGLRDPLSGSRDNNAQAGRELERF